MFRVNTWNIDGWAIEDVVQQAVLDFLDFIEGQPEEFMKNRANKGYVISSLRGQVRQVIADLCRKRGVRHRNVDEVKSTYYAKASAKTFEGFEEVEVKDTKDRLSPSFKVIARILEEGGTIEEVKEAIGVTSTRRYYKIYNNIKKVFEESGYSKSIK